MRKVTERPLCMRVSFWARFQQTWLEDVGEGHVPEIVAVHQRRYINLYYSYITKYEYIR
jgi:hypothetical protein